MHKRALSTLRQEKGFSILEASLFATVVLGIILSLFAVSRRGQDEAAFQETRQDYYNLIADIRYELHNDLFCKERLVLPNILVPGAPLHLRRSEDRKQDILKDAVLPEYGLKILQFRVYDGALAWDEYETTLGIEVHRLIGFRMQLYGDKLKEGGEYVQKSKHYFADILLEAQALNGRKLRAERLGRLYYKEHWDKKENLTRECFLVGTAENTLVAAPPDVEIRLGALLQPEVPPDFLKIKALTQTEKGEAKRLDIEDSELRQDFNERVGDVYAPRAGSDGRALSSQGGKQ